MRFSKFMLATLLVPPAIFGAMPRLTGMSVSGDAFALIFGLSVAHGGLSGLFWIDRRYRRYIEQDRASSYGVPLLILVTGLLGVAIFGKPFVLGFTAVYFGWTAVHFSRQNWGVLCLSASGLGTRPPARVEYHGCNLAGVGGALAVVAPLADALHMPAEEWVLVSTVGLVLVFAALALSIVAAIRQRREGAPLVQTALTLAVGVYFLPLFVLPIGIGFTCVGTAHALQYGLIMYRLAADERQGPQAPRVVGALAVAGVYVGAFFLFTNAALWGAWSGAAEVLLYSVVMWHFLLDARMFRLRQPVPRGIIRESLPFLFPAPRTPTASHSA